MLFCVLPAIVSSAVGFVLGVAFAGNVKQELKALHEKADAILAVVRRR